MPTEEGTACRHEEKKVSKKKEKKEARNTPPLKNI